MTKTVKKRLQAVVALLVSLMIMVGIMPTDILSTTVYAGSNNATQASEKAEPYKWFYVQIACNGTNYGVGNHIYLYPKWTEGTITAAGNTMCNISYTDANGNVWGGGLYAYGFDNSLPNSIEVKTTSNSYPSWGNPSNTTSQVGKSMAVSSPTAGHIYKIAMNSSGGYAFQDLGPYNPYDDDANGGGNNSSSGDDIVVDLEDHVTFAANIYDYHYDYEQNSGFKNTTPGTSKRPYSIFNDAVSHSPYGDVSDWSSTSKPPMYIGAFWRNDDNNGCYTSTTAGEVKGGDDGSSGDHEYDYNRDAGNGSGNESLNHFYWGANLAYRGTTSDRFYAAAMGLVDSQLVGGMLQTNGQNVPYFDTTFLETTYNGCNVGTLGSWGTTDFTFTKRKLKSSYPTETNTSKEYTADYYVYSSLGNSGGDSMKQDANGNPYRDNLKVTKGANGAKWSSSYTKDSSALAVLDADDPRKSGFLPFNNAYDARETINLGFGMKWQINFKVTSTGHLGDEDETPMVFKFEGDDDLWVFIDDVLVLDMGGAHKRAQGEINFKTKRWYINNAGQAKYQEIYGSGTQDDLGSKDGTFEIDRTKSHKMTIFYMERGMINSNLYIQYNFIPVEDSLTVKEVTDGFDQINPGLQALTRKAADYDVFTYNVQAAASTGKTNKVLVTGNTLTRTVVGKTDAFTTSGTVGTAYSYGTPGTPGSPAYLANVGYRWGDDFASISPNSTYKYMSGVTDGSGYFDLLYGTDAKSSYAKFENQIGRGQVVVAQQANLKKSVSGTISTTTRSVPTYYEVSVPGYDDETNDADSHKTAVATSLNTNPTGVGFTANNGAPIADFMFGLSPTYSADDAVNVTLTFRNTVKYYSITFSKGIVDTSNHVVSNNNDEFTFKLTLSDILGIDEVDVAADGYGGITITKGGNSDTLNGDGTFTAKASETVVIGGIPAGTNYSIVEVDASSNNTIALNGEFSIGDNAYKLNNMQNQTLTTGLLGDISVHFTNMLQDEETPSVDIGIIKRWYPLNSSTTLPTEIKFLLQKKSNGGDWEDVTTASANGVVTLTNANSKKYNAQGQEVTEPGAAYEYMEWKLAARITVPKENGVQYRILEYSEGNKALILLNEGLYATDCKAYYKDGNNDTNVKALSAATYANNTELIAALHGYDSNITASSADADIEAAITANKTALDTAHISTNKVVDLSVKNEYIPMGTAMPKTGARGVYAIVTFGAFAITIAGVALLIYRKKLQTVNIYAVKGSEKPKE